MNYVYNATKNTYQSIADFSAAKTDATDVLRVMVLTDLDQVFAAAKKRTALRGRFAVDGQNQSILEKLALTEDERDWFDEIIKNGTTEVSRKLSSWTKDITNATRHNVKFGNPLHSGIATTVAGAVLTDSTKAFTVDGLKDMKVVITTPGIGLNQERVILSNTATAITLASAFTADVEGMEYVVCPVTGNLVIYYLTLDPSWDLNLFLGVGAAIQEALVIYSVKEWYKINRNTNDYPIEEAEWNNQLSKIRGTLLQYKIPARRVTDFFQ